MIVTPHPPRIHRTAQQLIHRQPHRLPANVPQRLVNPADRRPDHRPRPVKTVHIHRLPVVLHLHRVRADQKILEILHTRHHRRRLALQRPLAPPVQPRLIRLQLHKDVRPVTLRRQRHPEYLQFCNSDLTPDARERLRPQRRLRHHRTPADVRRLRTRAHRSQKHSPFHYAHSPSRISIPNPAPAGSAANPSATAAAPTGTSSK